MRGEPDHVSLAGAGLTCVQVRAVARHGGQVELAAAGRARAEASWRVAAELVETRPVYGRNTGVGANRGVPVGGGPAERGAHGLALLRSHAGGAGPLVDAARVRAMLVVRLNQLAAGGSGVSPAVLDGLAEALARGLVPPVRGYGAIGTGDLAALATTALCLTGEVAWTSGRMPLVELDPADALAFVSSNAATIGSAALCCADLADLLDAGVVIAALAMLAVGASAEPYAPAVHEARPHRGQREVAARVRALLAGEGPPTADPAAYAGRDRSAPAPGPPRRSQDPYGYRALPQVHGAAVDAARMLDEVLAVELNAAAENPLVDVASRDVYHNGNFHAAYLSLALDLVRPALFQAAALSAARLGTMLEPGAEGRSPFLAEGPPTSSGLMIAEYVAHSALADIRLHAGPASVGVAVLSRGVEEHASFATQAADRTVLALEAYRVVLSCELVAAVRALRMAGTEPDGPLRVAYGLAAAVLDPTTADRPLDADLAAATELLPRLCRPL